MTRGVMPSDDVDELHRIATALKAFCDLLGRSANQEEQNHAALIEPHVEALNSISGRVRFAVPSRRRACGGER